MGAHRAGQRPVGSRRAGMRRQPRRKTGRLVIGGLAGLTTAVSVLGGLGVGGVNGAPLDLRSLTHAGSGAEGVAHLTEAELAQPDAATAQDPTTGRAIATVPQQARKASPSPTAGSESGPGSESGSGSQSGARGPQQGSNTGRSPASTDTAGQGGVSQPQELEQREPPNGAVQSKPSGVPVRPQSAAGAVRHGPSASAALPVRSGQGRRVVFSESAQRVWIVEGNRKLRRSYLVSGSLLDNLQPGTYEVFSRSRYAVGIQDSGVMERFVRFTHGPSGAAIGFHTIPTKDGVPLQTKAQLGTPQSHGCIRQGAGDALAMWDFAQVGTTVVVTA